MSTVFAGGFNNLIMLKLTKLIFLISQLFQIIAKSYIS
jgi:hypothetical protein